MTANNLVSSACAASLFTCTPVPLRQRTTNPQNKRVEPKMMDLSVGCWPSRTPLRLSGQAGLLIANLRLYFAQNEHSGGVNGGGVNEPQEIIHLIAFRN